MLIVFLIKMKIQHALNVNQLSIIISECQFHFNLLQSIQTFWEKIIFHVLVVFIPQTFRM